MQLSLCRKRKNEQIMLELTKCAENSYWNCNKHFRAIPRLYLNGKGGIMSTFKFYNCLIPSVANLIFYMSFE